MDYPPNSRELADLFVGFGQGTGEGLPEEFRPGVDESPDGEPGDECSDPWGEGNEAALRADEPDEVPDDLSGDSHSIEAEDEEVGVGEADEVADEVEDTASLSLTIGEGAFDQDELEGDPDGYEAQPDADVDTTGGSSHAGDTDPDTGDEADSITNRDERIGEYSGHSGHDVIREAVRNSGVAERIQQQLQDLFTGSLRPKVTDIRTERDGLGPVGGQYDMRQVVRRFAGDLRVDNIFQSPKPGLDDDVAVAVVLDLSGSMRGAGERKAKEAAGAFLFSVQLFGGDVVAVSYPGTYPRNVNLITAPTEPFRWPHLDASSAGGGTPTNEGVKAGIEYLEQLTADQYLVLVLTDGGAASVPKTRNIVDATRERGRDWEVIGFGFGNINDEQLAEQFGEEKYRSVTLEELPDELVDVYEAQVTGGTS